MLLAMGLSMYEILSILEPNKNVLDKNISELFLKDYRNCSVQ